MRVAHLLRKYNPAEWGGTETAIQRLFDGLRQHDVNSVIYCPRIPNGHPRDPLAESGCAVKRFTARVPIWGMPEEQKRQMIAVGGNLISFDLLRSLWREPDLDVIHSHAVGRLGGIGLTIAWQRRIPFVVTTHGGVYDLPDELKGNFNAPPVRGWEWGKLFGALVRSRRVFIDADAIIACNEREAALIREQHPDRRVYVQPHGVSANLYESDHRESARAAFPFIRDRQVLLAIGRIDPVKNPLWLVEQASELFRRHPRALLVLAGPCTDEAYGEAVRRRIGQLGLENHVVLTGGLPPADPRLVGLLQEAQAALLPSISETFGLVILESWAAGTPVIASRTSGASALIEHGRNGWLFDLDRPGAFHEAVGQVLLKPDSRAQLAAVGGRKVAAEYDTHVLAGRMKQIYEQLIGEKHALRHSS